MIRHRAKALCAGFVAAAFACGSGTAAPLAGATDIQSVLANYTAAHPESEVVVGVVDGGEATVYTANGTAAHAPDVRTMFQIGSVTKTFTATLLAQMVATRRLALDDPISKYLPPDVHVPTFDGKTITIRTLAEQTSGLPRLPPNLAPHDLANPYADYTQQELYAALSETRLARAPGAQYEYSNYGVTLLGQLLANRMHSTYAELLTARVLRPLGMYDTVVGGTQTSRANLAPGNGAGGTSAPPWDFGSLGAAGAIESNLHDMLLYLQANLAAPTGKLGYAMADAQRPRVPIGLNGILRIGLIWNTNVRSGITWHNGETAGYYAFIGFDRAANHGVVVLSNIADVNIEQIAVHILAPYVPAPRLIAASVKEPSPYSGVYSLSLSFAITIYKSGGKLYAQATGQSPLELSATGTNAFRTVGVDARITFDLDAKGNVTGLTLHQNGRDQYGERLP